MADLVWPGPGPERRGHPRAAETHGREAVSLAALAVALAYVRRAPALAIAYLCALGRRPAVLQAAADLTDEVTTVDVDVRRRARAILEVGAVRLL